MIDLGVHLRGRRHPRRRPSRAIGMQRDLKYRLKYSRIRDDEGLSRRLARYTYMSLRKMAGSPLPTWLTPTDLLSGLAAVSLFVVIYAD